MKKGLLFVFWILFIPSACTVHKNDISRYEKMKKDSLEVLIKSISHPPTYVDTLHAEMYIALKSMYKIKHNVSKNIANIVIDRANKLLAIEDDLDDRLHILEAKQIALGALKKEQELTEMLIEQGREYPAGSIKRMSYWISYHRKIDPNACSTKKYMEQCVNKAELLLKQTTIKEEKDDIAFYITIWLLWLEREKEAKSFMKKYIENEENEILQEALSDFSAFKEFVINM